MSFLVKVEGSESFEVAKECVRSVNVTTDIPLDSNARTKDVGATMVITGKILAALDKELKPFIYALPIEIEILQNQQDKFNQHIIDYVRENTRNRSLSER